VVSVATTTVTRQHARCSAQTDVAAAACRHHDCLLRKRTSRIGTCVSSFPGTSISQLRPTARASEGVSSNNRSQTRRPLLPRRGASQAATAICAYGSVQTGSMVGWRLPGGLPEPVIPGGDRVCSNAGRPNPPPQNSRRGKPVSQRRSRPIATHSLGLPAVFSPAPPRIKCVLNTPARFRPVLGSQRLPWNRAPIPLTGHSGVNTQSMPRQATLVIRQLVTL
jgi:hypothetical protein